MDRNGIKEEADSSLLIIRLLWRSILFPIGLCIIAFSIYWAIVFFDAFNNADTIFQQIASLIELLIMAVCGLIGVVLIK